MLIGIQYSIESIKKTLDKTALEFHKLKINPKTTMSSNENMNAKGMKNKMNTHIHLVILSEGENKVSAIII